MTPEDQPQIRTLADGLGELHDRLSAGNSSRLFAEFWQEDGTAILAANAEGLV
jgi:hypothetical protein